MAGAINSSKLIFRKITVNAETGFIEFKGWRPFKFGKKISASKQLPKIYNLLSLFTHLSFRLTIPQRCFFLIARFTVWPPGNLGCLEEYNIDYIRLFKGNYIHYSDLQY